MSIYTICLDRFYDSLYNLTGDDELYTEALSRFKACHEGTDVELFLKNKAFSNMLMSKSITYLSVDGYNGHILGYYTIALSFIPIVNTDEVSKSLKKKLKTVEIDCYPDIEVATTYLIGQLGRSEESEKGFGKVLLQEAIDKIREISLVIGCRSIRIDCKDDPRIIEYYRSNGFSFVKQSCNGLNILIYVICSDRNNNIIGN